MAQYLTRAFLVNSPSFCSFLSHRSPSPGTPCLTNILPTSSAFRLEKLEPSPAVFPIITGYTATEYETVQIVWKEKVRHDLARPPTIFEGKFRGMKARTWGGPYRSVQTVKRKDVEPYMVAGRLPPIHRGP